MTEFIMLILQKIYFPFSRPSLCSFLPIGLITNKPRTLAPRVSILAASGVAERVMFPRGGEEKAANEVGRRWSQGRVRLSVYFANCRLCVRWGGRKSSGVIIWRDVCLPFLSTAIGHPRFMHEFSPIAREIKKLKGSRELCRWSQFPDTRRSAQMTSARG